MYSNIKVVVASVEKNMRVKEGEQFLHIYRNEKQQFIYSSSGSLKTSRAWTSVSSDGRAWWWYA